MSNWTHVSGIIRVDSFRFDPLEPDFWEKTIGKECCWGSPKEVWDEAFDHGERFMPMGSEGSLHFEVWENPDQSHVDAYTVSIFGDLRDRDDPYEVIEWFHKACDRIEEVFCVRNAVIEVCNDWNGAATWSWCVYEVEKIVGSIPAADVEPKRHGRWVKMTGMMPPEFTGHYQCSECEWFCKKHSIKETDFDFCPGCGADMRKRNEDAE